MSKGPLVAESGVSPATKMIQLDLTANSLVYLLTQATITKTNLSFLSGLYLIHFPYTRNPTHRDALVLLCSVTSGTNWCYGYEAM